MKTRISKADVTSSLNIGKYLLIYFVFISFIMFDTLIPSGWLQNYSRYTIQTLNTFENRNVKRHLGLIIKEYSQELFSA